MNKSKQQLRCYRTGEILFEGWFDTIKTCIETAVSDGVPLDGVELSNQNLACANLDDAQMAGARLSGANLNGANLSEGVFDEVDFTNAELSYACMAQSTFMNANFYGASFGGTDVTDAVIRGCTFSCPSLFNTLLHRAAIFTDCVYVHERGRPCYLRSAPIVIQGLPRDIVYMDDDVKIGTDVLSKAQIKQAGLARLGGMFGEDVAQFLRPAMGIEADSFQKSLYGS